MEFSKKQTGKTEEETGQEKKEARSKKREEKEHKQEIKELKKEIEKIRELMEKKEEENEQLVARLQRAKADFSNYKKRIEKNRFTDKLRAQEELILDLLPVLDNFERALQVNPENKEAKNLCKGVEMIFKQLWTVLQQIGLQEIEALDKPFDPNLHEAVERICLEDKPAEMVVEVVQKGYKMGDRVLRPSMVKVNKGGDDDE